VNSFRCQPRYSGTSRLLTLAAIHACRSATAVPACSAVVQFPAVPQRPVLVPAGDGQQPRLGQRLDVRLLHIQTGPRSALGRGPVPPNRGICPDSGNDLLTARGDIISHGPRPTASVHVSFRNEPRCGTRLPLPPVQAGMAQNLDRAEVGWWMPALRPGGLLGCHFRRWPGRDGP
jgi:hypothetical protein